MTDILRAFEAENGLTITKDGVQGPFLTGGSSSPVGLDLPERTLYVQQLSSGITIWIKSGPLATEWIIYPASKLSFDPTNLDISATNVQDAIEQTASTASPGFGFGRSGSLSQNTWLRRTGNVPSNRAGVTININSPVVTQIACANRNVETYDIQIWEHDGNRVNETLLGTVTVINKTGDQFDVNFPATKGKQLAVKLGSTATGNVRDLGVDVTLVGNN